MKPKTSKEQISETSELLRSLQDTVRRVRQKAELLCEELQAGESSDLGFGNRQIAAIEGLVRSCHKVEIDLAEQCKKQEGIAEGGYALDLEQARSEVECRLARLRACHCETDLPE